MFAFAKNFKKIRIVEGKKKQPFAYRVEPNSLKLKCKVILLFFLSLNCNQYQ